MTTFLRLLLLAGLIVAAVLVVPSLLEKDNAVQRPDEDAELRAFDPSRIVVDRHLRREVVEDEVLVNLAPGARAADFEAWLEKQGWRDVRVVGRIPRVGVLQLSVSPDRRHAVRAAIDAEPTVASASLNTVWRTLRTFDDPALGPDKMEDWGLDRIGMPFAWDRTTGGAVVGVLDDGIRMAHEEMRGKLRAPYSFATRSERMQDRRYGTEPGAWISGHGTHVAVTIAGAANNGVGTAGVSPDSPVIPVQVLYARAEGMRPTGTDAEIIAGMEYAIDAGASVLNMSLGGGIHPNDHHAFQHGSAATRAAIDRRLTQTAREGLRTYLNVLALARERRVIIVKAAGNDSLPARWDSLCLSERVIGVAATDIDDRRSVFGYTELDGRPHTPIQNGSRYGPGTTVSAPGSRIWSGFADPTIPYMYMDGTSMAAPHVAGVVALMKSVKPDLTFEEARDILVSTGTRLETDHPIGPLVNAIGALRELDARIEDGVEPLPPEPPLRPGPPLPDPFEDEDVPDDLPLPPLRPDPTDPADPIDEDERPDLPTDPIEVDDGPEDPMDRIEADERPEDPTDPIQADERPDDRIEADERPADPTPTVPPPYEDVLKGPRPWDDPRVRATIDEWLRIATPPPGGRYNEWGVGIDNPNVKVKPNYKPDWAAQKYEFLWNNARDWQSQNVGTLYEYLHGLPLTSTVERPEKATSPSPPAKPNPTEPKPVSPPRPKRDGWVLVDRDVLDADKDLDTTRRGTHRQKRYSHGANETSLTTKTFRVTKAGKVLESHSTNRARWSELPREVAANRPIRIEAKLDMRILKSGRVVYGRNLQIIVRGADVRVLPPAKPHPRRGAYVAVDRDTPQARMVVEVTPRSNDADQISIRIRTTGYTVMYLYRRQ
ncbi:MAG: S8 family serine peptidase [Planctomycetota bacterium]|nr:S8 family serine peptidase [Planctomycetota bacterium]